MVKSIAWLLFFPLAAQASLQIPLPAKAISLDPTAVQDQSSLWISRQVNCQLMRLKQGAVVPEAVETYQFLSPTLIRMNLRPDFFFHDGSEVLADDVIATFETLKASRGVLRNIFGWVKKIEKKGPRQILFHLHRPVAQFLKTLSSPNYAIFKKSFLEAAKKEPGLWQKPMGCGRYQITSVDTRTLSLSPVRHAGLPITFHFGSDRVFTEAELQSFDLLAFDFATKVADKTKFREAKLFDPYHLLLGLNTQLPQWSTKKNRCELFAQVNKAGLLAAYGGEAEDAKDIFPRGILGFSPAVDYKAELTARKGIAHIAVPQFCLAFLTVSVPRSRWEPYTAMLTAPGRKVTTTAIEKPQYFGKQFQEMKCDALVLGLKSNYLDGYEYLLLFAEESANFTGYWDKKLKADINSSQDIEDPQKKATTYQQIAQRLRDECLLMPLITLPMKTVLVRNERMTPGLGEQPLNEYYLGHVQ